MGRFRFFLLAASLLIASIAFAQVSGTVGGVIVDASGAVVPEAAVTLQLPGTSAAVFNTKTNTSGAFILVSVPPNTYDLTVDAKGFVKRTFANVRVEPGRTVDLNTIKVEVASVAAAVEVSEVTTTVQTSNAEVTTTIVKSQIQSLPVLNRSPLAFLSTQVGVNYNGATGTTINGQRVTYSSITLDGISIQDNFIRTNAMDYLPNMLLMDQISEVTVSTSNGSSANAGSGQVNFSTPSGGPQYHGNALWSNRNNYFRANSFFNNQSKTPVAFLNQNQISGNIGGPILKNKLFFYTNYEAFRLHQQTTQNKTILTADARSGVYTYKDSAGAVQKVNILQAMGKSIDATMKTYLDLVPAAAKANYFGTGDSTSDFLRNTVGYRMNRQDNRIRDNFTLKGDYYFSPVHSFTATFAYNRDIDERPDQDTTYGLKALVENNNPTKLLSTAWRWNPSPTLTNEVRIGFNLAPGVFLDTQDIPAYFVTGTSYTNPIANVLRTQGRNTNTYVFSDNATWAKGSHSLQFGFQFQTTHAETFNDGGSLIGGITPTYALGIGTTTPGLTSTQLPGISPTDLATANTLYTTLAGLYVSGGQTFNVSTRNSGFVKDYGTWRHLVQGNYAVYAQDSWKLSRRLTAKLGIRWDYYPPVDERDGLGLLPVFSGSPLASVFDPNLPLDFAGNAVGRPWWTPQKRNIAPNIGLAWDPTGKSDFVIRAGYSFSYVNDNILRAADNSISTNGGLTSNASVTGLNGVFGSGVTPIPTPTYKVPRTLADNYAISTSSALAFPDPNLVTPYVQQWNFSIEKKVKSYLVNVRYVGNHATKMIRGLDYNQIVISQLLPNFKAAANNGWLAKAATGSFVATYNANIPGSQPLPYFTAMPNSGYLTNSNVVNYLQTGAVGELANFYMINRINGSNTYFRNPNIQGGNMITNFSSSVYNGLQAEVTRHLSHGLYFQANYTYSKVLSDAGDTQTDFEPLLDINNAKIERRRSGFDLTHVIKANFGYDLPIGPGKRFNPGSKILGRILEGWNVAGIWTHQSGNPFSVVSGRGTFNRSARSGGNTANTFYNKSQLDQLFQVYMTGDGPMFFPQANWNPLDKRAVSADGAAPFTGQVFFQPEAGTIGTLQRNMFSGPWTWSLDAKIAKITKIDENRSLELRMDASNALNHTTWYVGDQTVTTTSFGKITSQFYSNRIVQFSAYFRF